MLKKLLIKLGLRSTFSQRISQTLGVFTTAKNDLIKLTDEITAEREKNTIKISKLIAENDIHDSSIIENKQIVANINLLLGGK